MKALLILIPVIALSGCSLFCPKPEIQYITKNTYVVRQAPVNLYDMPPTVAPLNTSTMTQKDVAEWIARKNSRELSLEKTIQSISEFYSRPIDPVTGK
jgi:hypothetical protein